MFGRRANGKLSRGDPADELIASASRHPPTRRTNLPYTAAVLASVVARVRTALPDWVTAIRGVVFGVAGFLLLLVALCEVVMAWPIPRTYYAGLAFVFAVACLRFLPLRRQWGYVLTLAVAWSALATLHFVDWNTRKPFLRDLDRIQPGMTEPDVRRIMGHYIEGTGWPANPLAPEGTGTVRVVPGDSQWESGTSHSGELTLKHTVVFRHSHDGAFASDWGIVTFAAGRVVSVQFSPD